MKPFLIFMLLFSFFAGTAHSQEKHKTKKSKAITHQYADINGVKLHYAKAG